MYFDSFRGLDDPLFVCAGIGMCPRNLCTGSCINITDIDVTPAAGPLGTVFQANVSILVNKPTGVGALLLRYTPSTRKAYCFSIDCSQRWMYPIKALHPEIILFQLIYLLLG
jgi:hypothetical protein